MRICGSRVVNTVWFDCAISGSKLGLKYRLPTTSERIEFDAKSLTRDGTFFYSTFSQAQQELGRKIIVGIEPGCFATEEGVPLASDESHENYHAGWRELVVDSGSIDDLIAELAALVFRKSIKQRREAIEIDKKN